MAIEKLTVSVYIYQKRQKVSLSSVLAWVSNWAYVSISKSLGWISQSCVRCEPINVPANKKQSKFANHTAGVKNYSSHLLVYIGLASSKHKSGVCPYIVEVSRDTPFKLIDSY
jgi:hypothetical protein